ncbi:UDP-4-amino-4,6-dideoxy-N-acetyl-beta-L-altrosamine transaminase [Azospirillum melinis]|uniref:UDP-4-amino-4, 6-dideoxy-N-acetyl-beta-L-altrosamine transaminase n=1 Tax=Azospirillum melinis TaxID=328839 RepID=A0ABX2KCM2_9PROT|nr:UDP-4-amino-4,6-dideoxy-N-acetyl-beta-L-altrosamine transaminase [Azospirillum melinis]MBP2307337.1 UDP-4-amino-4,6-dideoxy-N-acetyl-beta-L-altrosamine transaminase [Azospirillum melinis]NUB01352.1 UDP-4-amino-4,6-dideoxy-N-acetyl-beta-L-altrosamine transaminase [Azospirillum melinis]
MAGPSMGDLPFLPYGRQSVDEEDIAAVAAVLRGDWLTQGPTVSAFERALAARVGAADAVACANGTAALRLAYAALGIGPGDAVVVPSNTFLATASAARHAGAEVAFADVDPDSGLMGVAEAEAAIARASRAGWRVRALAPVHYAGQTAPMDGLAALAQAEGLALVEDACHAIGTACSSGGLEVPVGAGRPEVEAGSLTVFSFHPVKTIAAGEGGALTGSDPALMARVRRLCNHGMMRTPDPGEGFADPGAALDAEGNVNPWYYEMAEPGFNHRLSDIHAALVLSQLGRLDRFIERRARLMALYAERLAPLAPLVRPPALVPGCRPAWHLCAARIDFAAAGRTRSAVMVALRALGVGTQVHYIPVHRQPYWRRRYGDLALPGAMSHYVQTLSLPLFPAMADGDVDRVAAALERVLS